MPNTSPLINVADPGILQAEAQSATFLEFDRALGQRSPVIDGLFKTVQSNKANEDFATMESLPLPRIWNKNEARTWTSIKDLYINIVNRKWQGAISWSIEDEEDAQVQSIPDKARMLGQRFAELDERIAIQLIESGTDNLLLPSIPNAYDGSALVSTSTRFGVSGGNQVTGSGVSTVNAIVTDLYAVKKKFRQMQDTEGQPFYQSEDVSFKNFRIIAPEEIEEVLTRALSTKMMPASGTFSDASNNLSNASVDNPIFVKDGDLLNQVYFTQRLSDVNDYYIYLDVPFVKPLVILDRVPLSVIEYKPGTSDWGGDYDMKGVGFRMRRGYGVGAPQAFIKVSNS